MEKTPKTTMTKKVRLNQFVKNCVEHSDMEAHRLESFVDDISTDEPLEEEEEEEEEEDEKEEEEAGAVEESR